MLIIGKASLDSCFTGDKIATLNEGIFESKQIYSPNVSEKKLIEIIGNELEDELDELKVIYLINTYVTRVLREIFPTITFIVINNLGIVDENLEDIPNLILLINKGLDRSESVFDSYSKTLSGYNDLSKEEREFISILNLITTYSWSSETNFTIKDKAFLLMSMIKLFNCLEIVNEIKEDNKYVFTDEKYNQKKYIGDELNEAIASIMENITKDSLLFSQNNIRALVLYNINTKFFSLIATKLFKLYNRKYGINLDFITNVMPNGRVNSRAQPSREKRNINITELHKLAKGRGGGIHSFAAGGLMFSTELKPTSKVYDNKEILIDVYMKFLTENI